MQKLKNLIKSFFLKISRRLLGIGKDNPTPPDSEEWNFRKLPDGTVLPEPMNVDEAKHLINSIHSVHDKEHRFVYDTVFISALERVRPLLDLYDLIPRIWNGDSAAESEFNKILSENRVGVSDLKAYENRAEKSMQIMRSKIPAPDGGSPCNPLFFIKPDTVFSILQTATWLAGRDEKKHLNNLAIIDKIWENALCPDLFNFLAHQDKLDGRNQLHETIIIIAERNEYFEQIDQLKNKRQEANGGNIGLTQPPPGEGGPWRPPIPGSNRPPIGCGPDDGPVPVGPRFPENCNPIRDYCNDFLRGAGRGIRSVPDSISTENIGSISTSQACLGGVITINGHDFGQSQGNFKVVFGTHVAQVISWSDTKIVVIVPAGLSGRYCIGIRNEEIEDNRREIYEGNRRAFGEFSEGASVCLGQPGAVGMLPYRPDAPKCSEINVVNIGVPSINFWVNGGIRGTVESGNDLILSWAVTNADRMKINRVGTNGPSANITSPLGGRKNIGSFSAGSELTASYILEASNSCGTASRKVEITAVRTPQLSILGIEVTQPIQRFNWDNPGQNNSVRLVSEKRTMVRVYVESGVNDGFDFGRGSNILPDVTGHLTLTYPGGNKVTVNNILNPNKINAQPLVGVDRGNLEHSINFELPVNNLDGTIQIDAEVYTEPHIDEGRWNRQSTSVTFQHNGGMRLVAILVNDTVNSIAAPTMADYAISLQGARTRLPMREAGFLIVRAPNHMTINTQRDEDLTTDGGWSNLLDRLDDIADDYSSNSEIWTGLVPNGQNYAWGGLATDGVVSWWFDNNRRMLSCASQGATFAHELSHAVSIDHAPSVDASTNPLVHSCGNPDGVDNTMVSLTEDIGIDVAAYRRMPQGIPTLMTYCVPDFDGIHNSQDTWMSIDLWNRLWNKI